jgi:hypothetical protein
MNFKDIINKPISWVKDMVKVALDFLSNDSNRSMTRLSGFITVVCCNVAILVISFHASNAIKAGQTFDGLGVAATLSALGAIIGIVYTGKYYNGKIEVEKQKLDSDTMPVDITEDKQ